MVAGKGSGSARKPRTPEAKLAAIGYVGRVAHDLEVLVRTRVSLPFDDGTGSVLIDVFFLRLRLIHTFLNVPSDGQARREVRAVDFVADWDVAGSSAMSRLTDLVREGNQAYLHLDWARLTEGGHDWWNLKLPVLQIHVERAFSVFERFRDELAAVDPALARALMTAWRPDGQALPA